MAKERCINFGHGYFSDPNKTKEENAMARKEYYKNIGIDISDLTPEKEKEILDEFRKEGLIDF
jgi:hypothetical protein